MEEDIGYLIASVSILRDMNIQFTEKSRNKLADRIANLIARNKELEVINKMQEYRISVIDERELIPKSKVKEKIEELEAMSISQDIYYDDVKKLLQELLED